MASFLWNEEKNRQLIRDRGIPFQEIALHLASGDLKDDEGYETEAEMEAMGLDEEEKELLRSYNRGEWQSVSMSDKELQGVEEAARNTLEILDQDHEITIRLPGSDLIGIRGMAFEQGVHCKALIAAVLHKYATGKLGDTA